MFYILFSKSSFFVKQKICFYNILTFKTFLLAVSNDNGIKFA